MAALFFAACLFALSILKPVSQGAWVLFVILAIVGAVFSVVIYRVLIGSHLDRERHDYVAEGLAPGIATRRLRGDDGTDQQGGDDGPPTD
ncbi:hypothetical protein [Woodsholea maritima]|uniref:hypothetical protein n=1 Tax=Woodsholea maritima TaxID=240237 RepID=UPI0003A27F24|nr:hypothetical protein [Woodsholea maritima]